MEKPPLPRVPGQPPRLAIHLPSYADSPVANFANVIEIARLADQLGIDRVSVAEHVLLGESLGDYSRPELGGRRGGHQPTGPNGSYLDPIVLLSVIAGITSRVRLGTAVLLAALRRPVLLAKETSTLDVLSNGRLDLGVGIGWQREEYAAAALDFGSRGRLLDHCLEVCQLFWTTERASRHAGELQFDNLHQMPKPLQQGGVPLWIGGSPTDRVMERIVRFGSGWLPWGLGLDDLAGPLQTVRQALARAGRDPGALAVSADLPRPRSESKADVARTVERIPELVALGVTDFRIHVPAEPEITAEILEAFVPAAHAAGA